VGLIADTGASNFSHSCLGATFAPVDDGFDVVIVSSDRVTGEDTDGTADVYRATVQPADRLVGLPRFASFGLDAACGPLAGVAGVDRLVDIATDGTFLLLASNQGSSGLVGRLDCP
jgi:hypothetical protein